MNVSSPDSLPKSRSSIVVALLLAVLGFGLIAATRPSSEFNLMTLLNGQPTRWIMPDGGPSGMFGTGQQCMSLTGAPTGVIKLVSTVPTGFCVRPEANGYAWDGGCNALIGDMNFAEPWQAYVPYYVTVSPSGAGATAATHVCQFGDGGTTLTAAWAQQ